MLTGNVLSRNIREQAFRIGNRELINTSKSLMCQWKVRNNTPSYRPVMYLVFRVTRKLGGNVLCFCPTFQEDFSFILIPAHPKPPADTCNSVVSLSIVSVRHVTDMLILTHYLEPQLAKYSNI
jgi:hypothetical protein